MFFETINLKKYFLPKKITGRPNHIYIIKNKINNKVYVGQTWQHPKERFAYHMNDKHSGCKKLFNAIKSHEKNNFYLEILAICWDQMSADWLEKYYIIKFNSIKNGYNIIDGGTATGIISEEHKNNISRSTTGRTGKSGEDAPFFGRQHSDKTKVKMSEAQKNKPKTKEHCDNLSKAWETRDSVSDETRLKMSQAKLGVKKSPQHIVNIIAAKKVLYIKKRECRNKLRKIINKLPSLFQQDNNILIKEDLDIIYKKLCNSLKLIAGTHFKV